MKLCRECGNEVSESAQICPNCGAPKPSKSDWDGFGWEYKSKFAVFGLPLVHISFKYRRNRTPVVAKGIISIGQFGIGVVNISQIGIGFFASDSLLLLTMLLRRSLSQTHLWLRSEYTLNPDTVRLYGNFLNFLQNFRILYVHSIYRIRY